jgi:hypothetical protein
MEMGAKVVMELRMMSLNVVKHVTMYEMRIEPKGGHFMLLTRSLRFVLFGN